MFRGCPPGIIHRDGGSMAQEMLEVRGSRPGGAPAAGDFTLGDVFYFHKKGMESIVDDQVTQCFSSEELASWNLLTRTNQNFRYISLRLTVIWGVGVFVRYCVLFPLRSVRRMGLAPAIVEEKNEARSSPGAGWCVDA